MISPTSLAAASIQQDTYMRQQRSLAQGSLTYNQSAVRGTNDEARQRDIAILQLQIFAVIHQSNGEVCQIGMYKDRAHWHLARAEVMANHINIANRHRDLAAEAEITANAHANTHSILQQQLARLNNQLARLDESSVIGQGTE